MKISARPLKGEPFDVEVQMEETVEALKAKVAAMKPDMPAEAQKIVHQGRVLANSATVQESGLKEGDFVVVMLSKAAAKPAEAVAAAAPPAAPALPAATAAAPAPAPEPAAAAQAAAAVAGPDAMEPTIQQLCDMGFPRSEVEKCLRAAFGNADRAVEYLMSGIPQSALPSAQPPAPTPAPAPAPGQVPAPAPMPQPPFHGMMGAPAAPATGPLARLLNHPQFPRLRAHVQQDPRVLNQVLSVIAQQDASLIPLIAEHQEEFVAALQEPAGPPGAAPGAPQDPVSAMLAAAQAAQAGGGGAPSMPPAASPPQPAAPPAAPAPAQLTAEEQEAIGRLQALGFDRRVATEAYLACNKNEELAANYLFEAMEE